MFVEDPYSRELGVATAAANFLVSKCNAYNALLSSLVDREQRSGQVLPRARFYVCVIQPRNRGAHMLVWSLRTSVVCPKDFVAAVKLESFNTANMTRGHDM